MQITQRILQASILGAHSNSSGQGFRPRDVRFIAELFTNWLDALLKPDQPKWHNTQIIRYLNECTEKGWLRTQKKSTKLSNLIYVRRGSAAVGARAKDVTLSGSIDSLEKTIIGWRGMTSDTCHGMLSPMGQTTVSRTGKPRN